MFISFSFSKCDIKTGIKKITLVEKHANHFEQTLKLYRFDPREVRSENKLPARFLFYAVNLNSGHKKISVLF